MKEFSLETAALNPDNDAAEKGVQKKVKRLKKPTKDLENTKETVKATAQHDPAKEVVELLKEHTRLLNKRQEHRKRGIPDSDPQVAKILADDENIEKKIESHTDKDVERAVKARRVGISHGKKLVRSYNLTTNKVFQDRDPLPETKPQKLRKMVNMTDEDISREEKVEEVQKKLASLESPEQPIEIKAEKATDPYKKQARKALLKAVAKGKVEGYRTAHSYLDQADQIRAKIALSPEHERAAMEEEAKRLIKKSEETYDAAEKDFIDTEERRLQEKAPDDIPEVAFTPGPQESEVEQPRSNPLTWIKNGVRNIWAQITKVVDEQTKTHYESRGLIEKEEEVENDLKEISTPEPAVLRAPEVPEVKTIETDNTVAWQGDWENDDRPKGYEDVESRYKAAKRKGFAIAEILGQDFMNDHDVLLDKAAQGSLTKSEVSRLLEKNRQFHESIDAFNERYKAEHPRKPHIAQVETQPENTAIQIEQPVIETTPAAAPTVTTEKKEAA